MKDDLLQTKERLLAAIKAESLETFVGAYPYNNVPEIHWNSELEPDAGIFVKVAKSLGAQAIYVNWVVFSEDHLEEALPEDLEGTDDPSVRERNRAVSEFKRYVGAVASVRGGFFLHGVFHVFEQETEWYEEFGVLIGEEESDEVSDHRRGPELTEEAQSWAEKLARHPSFGRAKGWNQRNYLLRKLAGREISHLPVEAILTQAENIYEVDVRPNEEQLLAEQVREMKEKGLSIIAIAGKTNLPRERVRMLLAKLED